MKPVVNLLSGYAVVKNKHSVAALTLKYVY